MNPNKRITKEWIDKHFGENHPGVDLAELTFTYRSDVDEPEVGYCPICGEEVRPNDC